MDMGGMGGGGMGGPKAKARMGALDSLIATLGGMNVERAKAKKRPPPPPAKKAAPKLPPRTASGHARMNDMDMDD